MKIRTVRNVLRKGLYAIACMMFFMFLTNEAVCASETQHSARINLDLQNVELRSVLKEIKAQTQLDFVYNAREINDKNIVSISVHNADIHTALSASLNGLDVDYVINDMIVILQKKIKEKQKEDEYYLLKGVVRENNKDPLPGVTVLVKGTNTGISTDADGRFELRVLKGDKVPVLQFSFIGMETQEYRVVKPEAEINIVLQEAAASIEEVIITGMQTIKKDRMTGSASVLTAKDLKMQGITSIDRILDGMVAGLNSTTISGAPGARAKITIRGENNLSGNTEPLWIVDGLPMMSGVPKNTTGDYAGSIMQDGVGNIMPDDIESISILKDASAAAIYGARAANGVIVVTTKKGFRSKTQINYNANYEYGTAPSNRLDFMNSEEKLAYEQSIINNYGPNYAYLTGRGGYMFKRSIDGYMLPSEYASNLEKLKKINTDWFDVLFRTSHSQSHNVNLRGGSEELMYYTSINYQDQNGILISNKYQNTGLLFKLDYRPNDKLIVALNVSANVRKNQDNASLINPFSYAMFANPYERPYDENGNYSSDLSFLSNNYTTERASGYVYNNFNIMREMQETRERQDGSDVEATFNIKYEVAPGLSLESIVRKGISYNTNTIEVEPGTYTSWKKETFARRAFKDYSLMPDGYDNGELSENSGKNFSWSIRNQVDYSFNLKEDHLFSILLANEVMSKKFTNFGYTSPIYSGDYRITGIPYFDTNTSYEDLIPAINNMFNTSDGQDRSVSFLSSLRYGFKDRYIVNFNYRADGADVIGNTNRFTPLWSVGLRYNLHNEEFFENSIISELSLRGSFGYTGNIDRTAYPFSTIAFGSNMYEGNRYATNFTYPNPTVGWEKKRDRNAGIDMSLFKNRINLTVDYYSNRTDNILENLKVPHSTGRESVLANGGIVENSGLEFYTNIRWISNHDFAFNTSFNIARNKNVIKKSHYNYSTWQEATKHSVSMGGIINLVGKETGGIYGWEFAGVNPETGNPQYYLTDAGKRAYAKVLDGWDSYGETEKREYGALIKDLNNIPDFVGYNRGSDFIPSYLMPSMKYLGRSTPKFVGGFNTYLRYKSIEFTTSWTFKTDYLIPNFNDYQNAPNNEANADRAALGYSSDLKVSSTNRERKYLQYWQFPGDNTNVPRFTTATNDYWASTATTEMYSNGDFLRMTNLSVNYRFPSDLVKRMKMQNLSLGFSARNLLTYTKYRGLDVASGSAFSYPVARQFNFKLSVGF